MRKEVFELRIGERFTVDGVKHVCIRPYGEHDNVLAMTENKKMVRLPSYTSCSFVPRPDFGDIPSHEASVTSYGDVVKLSGDSNIFETETFLVLENTGTEIKCKVLETGLITSLSPFQRVEIIQRDTSKA